MYGLKFKQNFYILLFSIFVLICFFVASSAYCSESIILDPIIVTAKSSTEEYQTGDVDKQNTPAFYHRIERDEFEGKTGDLSEVIENQTGIQVRQTGGLGSFSTVSIRGASSEQVMVYVDGILMNDAAGGGVDLSNISLADVESIEIYQGISPINFNKASIGGVININTIRTKPGFNADITSGYGSFNTKNISGLINHKPGAFDYLISANYLSSDNDFRMLNDNGTPLNPDDDKWEDRNNAQFDQGNILTRFGYDFAGNKRIDAMNGWFSKTQHLPSWNNSETTRTQYDTDQDTAAFRFIADGITPFCLNTISQVNYFTKIENYDDSQGAIGLGAQKMRYDTDRIGASFFSEEQSDHQHLGINLSAQQEIYQSKDLLIDQNINKSQRQLFIAGVQDSIFFLNQTASLTPAIRYQYWQDELKYSIGSNENQPTRSNDYYSPQIGLKYSLSPELAIKSNIAKYVREPSFFELYGDRGFFVGNPGLKPEKGMNYDAGVEFSKELSFKWFNRTSMSTACFRSDITDLITRSYDARGIGKSENISDAAINGVETELTLDTAYYLRFIQRYTWQDTQNESSIAAFNGNQLPGRFENSWLSRVEINYLHFKIFTEYVNENGMYYDTANLLKAKAKSVINSGISWLCENWLVTLDARNLTSDQYQDFNGYPSPGRSFFFSIKYGI